MAGEFITSTAPGSTLYARIRNAASLLWNGTAFIVPSGTSFAASLKVAMVDLEGTGDFIGDCPSGAITAGATKYEVSLQAGGSPASTDSLIAAGDLFVVLPTTPPAGYGGDGSVTFTAAANAVNAPVPVAGAITIRRGDTYSFGLTGIGSLIGRTGLYMTAKAFNTWKTDPDTSAMLQFSEGGGLLRIAGAAATSSDGTMTVTDSTAGNITWHLTPAGAAMLVPGGYVYDVQMDTSGGSVTVASGSLTITADVTRMT